MFLEYKSSSLNELAKSFSDVATSGNFGKPLEKKWVIVQNKEAQQWLTLKIAEYNGIAFNIEFILPSELMWKLYRLLHPETPKNLPSDRIPMAWNIFDELEGNRLKNIISSNLETSKNKLQFADQIADVFDLYQVYRPDLLRAWDNNKLLTKDDSELWQSRLWRMLKKSWGIESPKLPNRSDAFFDLLNNLAQLKNDTDQIPDSIFVFGISQASNPFLELITELSLYIDTHYFGIEISKDLEDSSEEIHNLIEDWGESKREADKLLKELLLNKEIETRTIKINSNLKNTAKRILNGSSQSSIEIHSCHSKKREAEILKDCILRKLNEDLALKLEDILILVPDIDEYSSVLESVFFGLEGELNIPIHTPYFNQDSVQICFLNLLDLVSGSFKISSVMDFLEQELISQRFEITLDEIQILKTWLSDNNIHWGISREDSNYSFEKATLSLLSGFSIENDTFEMFNTIIPYPGIHSSNQAELTAKFSNFISVIRKFGIQLETKKTVSEWLSCMEVWLNTIFKKETSLENQSLRNVLSRAQVQTSIANSSSQVNFSLFKDWFAQLISDKKATSSGLGNGIVLSTYIPYRSIPFKSVFVLGMNEGAFPRRSTRPSFDLINKYPKAGDRIMKDDDELLFLEILKSTSDSLSISYLGQDQHSEDERLPSILIQQLLDVLPGLEVVKHKLHSFDSSFKGIQNFSLKAKRLSDIMHLKSKKNALFYDQKLEDGEVNIASGIEINSLIYFFSHPCKYMLNNKLLISNLFLNSAIEDREVFTVSALKKYKLDQVIFQGIKNQIGKKHLKKYTQRAGFTPIGIPGEKRFTEEFDEINSLLKLGEPYLTEEPENFDLELEIDGKKVNGQISEIYKKRRVVLKASRLKAKDLIQHWITHLALLLSTSNVEETILIGQDQYRKNQIYSFGKVSNTKSILNELIDWHKESFTNKSRLNFFPESSKAFFEAPFSRSPKDPLKEALKQWRGSNFKSGEEEDFYNSLLWRGEEPLEISDFEGNAKVFWEPLLKHFKKITNE